MQWVCTSCWVLHIVSCVQQLYAEGNAGPRLPTSRRSFIDMMNRLTRGATEPVQNAFQLLSTANNNSRHMRNGGIQRNSTKIDRRAEDLIIRSRPASDGIYMPSNTDWQPISFRAHSERGI